MKIQLLSTAASIMVVSPMMVHAAPAPVSVSDAAQAPGTTSAPPEELFSTGVAKGRDRLDSATSTSALRGDEIEKFGARSLAEVLRNIPGIRAESAGGEGNGSYSIRGLPLASSGSKYLQFQEDGLPVLEFGDLYDLTPDIFLRADFNLAQIETIRGGSASTFASNSPGGVINLISKTGDVEGGAVQASMGLNYGEHRLDFDYGHKLSDTLRFHVGGFYRKGEGPRHVGYDAYRGGQIKLNITKTLPNGYIRVYGKYLDDHTPAYTAVPIRVTGTNANPTFANFANFDIKRDSLLSRNLRNAVALDQNNNPTVSDVHEGMHPIVKSVGVEAQFDFGEWTVSEKFRFSDISGGSISASSAILNAAPALINVISPGGYLTYANGPNAGQRVVDPATLGGNGLLSASLLTNYTINSLNNATNDLRATRSWKVGGGNLTVTAGFYKSLQTVDTFWSHTNILTDAVGGGNVNFYDFYRADGTLTTINGVGTFGSGTRNGGFRRRYDVQYDVNAPYGSLNFHVGKLAIGASVRYDMGSVKGQVYGGDLGGGRIGVLPIDINGDGVIAVPEQFVSVLPPIPAPIDYSYHYLSYSAGINFRIAEPLAVFGRYSRGGRAAADRILFTPGFDRTTGDLLDRTDGYDTVKQAELGLKFRKSGVTVNITGFSATTGERNLQQGPVTTSLWPALVRVEREYSAKGIEFEGGIRRGVFGLTAGATYTSAKIAKDLTNPAVIGNKPRHQASFIFEATPQIDTKYATIGANFIGTTSSYAQDTNLLKLPGYTLVNAFVQVRPVERVQLMLNVNNLFDALALTDITQASIPANGIVTGRSMLGRTISGAVRYSF